ncbi:DUF1289 domain-containing protein [Pseudocolwellia agarivorans]|uniref:DUF1289 domain-containing protein n=1 Tax=Pseudocolwellia agarivorans TaxID=1911682 RepID=UPI001FEBC4E2|nr:DUF1289 domain-containing protein [Pseudocolwellia agarivorans]
MIESPCVRNCCLDKEDVCVGCFRHIKEIVGWKNLTDEGKKTVLASCEERKAQLKNINITHVHPAKHL